MSGILLRGGPFSIATFIPDVVVQAVGQDALGITGFPCEDGVTRADHSFKLPVRLEMVAGWSDSSAGQAGYINQIYRRLLALQATRQPFTISTGRRLHRNMLMESLTDPIGAATMYAMLPRITFRELIISRTQESGAAGNSTTAGVGAGAPVANRPAVDQGTVQPDLVNFSGQSGTPFGGYDPRLGIGPSTVDGSLGGMQVDGIGTFDNSLGDNTGTGTDPSQLGGNPGLFGRYSPGAFSDVQPFRI